ncbi:MAG: hypothetical protein GY758_34475 [Fuerstiella sp.]|nr:hypothetical protein [Fuerstiella sp.]MCP4511769.1 hypothetical protein [Fuerstiella sp.]MDG2127818.1 hypothetical protein [Fuerstiella sp.]
MKYRDLIQFSIGAAAALVFSGVVAADEPLLTNTTSFRIPFAVESAGVGQISGYAVLFVSTNGGPLEQVQKEKASAGGFQFEAPGDGLYSFAVRVTDNAGNLVGNSGPLQPELQVLVDISAPALQFQLAETASGQVNISWKTSANDVDPGGIRVEYAEGINGRWRPLQGATTSSGQTTVQSSPGTSVSVRGFVTDLAGNQGTGTGQIVLSAATPSGAANSPSVRPGMQAVPGINGQPTGLQVVGTTPFRLPPQDTTNGTASEPYRSQMPFNNASYNPAIPDSSMQSISSDVLTPGLTQVVNNRVFDIPYQIDDVGPSGVSSVDLFVTEDNGRQWFRYDSDVDLQSPFQVDTRGEGTFGFAVRVRNGLGFSEPPPQPGERPSIVILVDQTPPTAELAQPQILADGQGRVRLAWQVADLNMSSAPVRLESAVSAAGPWTPLFDWQTDERSFEMPILPGTPTTLHFRLLARDAAGNVTTAQTAEPVLIDQQRPKARLLRVQPASVTRTY